METFDLIPPWWVLLAAAVPVIASGVLLYRWVARDELKRVSQSGEHSLRAARARSVVASIVFSVAIALAGWVCWLLAALAGRGWAPMGPGSIRSPRKVCRYPGSGRPIAALR